MRDERTEGSRRDDLGLLRQLGAWRRADDVRRGRPSPLAWGRRLVDLGRQAHEPARVVAGVRVEQPGDPAPCEGTSVAALLDHPVGLTPAFRTSDRRVVGPGGSRWTGGTSRTAQNRVVHVRT